MKGTKALIFSLLTLSLLAISSCAKKGPSVPSQFVFSAAATGADTHASGGVVLAGQLKNGQDKFILALESVNDDVELELDAGEWSFYAINWDGPGHMEGEHFCDVKDIDISGSSAEVSLSLTRQGCKTDRLTYSPLPNEDISFRQLILHPCLLMEESITGPNVQCPHRPSLIADSISYRVRLRSHFNGSQQQGITSRCLSASGPDDIDLGQDRIETPLFIPTGGQDRIFSYDILAYEDLNCQNPSVRYQMADIALNASENSSTKYKLFPDGNMNVLYFLDNVVGFESSVLTHKLPKFTCGIDPENQENCNRAAPIIDGGPSRLYSDTIHAIDEVISNSKMLRSHEMGSYANYRPTGSEPFNNFKFKAKQAGLAGNLNDIHLQVDNDLSANNVTYDASTKTISYRDDIPVEDFLSEFNDVAPIRAEYLGDITEIPYVFHYSQSFVCFDGDDNDRTNEYGAAWECVENIGFCDGGTGEDRMSCGSSDGTWIFEGRHSDINYESCDISVSTNCDTIFGDHGYDPSITIAPYVFDLDNGEDPNITERQNSAVGNVNFHLVGPVISLLVKNEGYQSCAEIPNPSEPEIKEYSVSLIGRTVEIRVELSSGQITPQEHISPNTFSHRVQFDVSDGSNDHNGTEIIEFSCDLDSAGWFSSIETSSSGTSERQVFWNTSDPEAAIIENYTTYISSDGDEHRRASLLRKKTGDLFDVWELSQRVFPDDPGNFQRLRASVSVSGGDYLISTERFIEDDLNTFDFNTFDDGNTSVQHQLGCFYFGDGAGGDDADATDICPAVDGLPGLTPSHSNMANWTTFELESAL